MGRISVLPRVVRTCLAVGGVFAGVITSATVAASNTVQTDEVLSYEIALATVQEYQELRKTCADEVGDARRSCFHQLNASNTDYRAARDHLNLVKTEDPENIHLVSF